MNTLSSLMEQHATFLRIIVLFVLILTILLLIGVVFNVVKDIVSPPARVIIAVAYLSDGQNPSMPSDLTASNAIFEKLKELEKRDPQGVGAVQIPRVFVGSNVQEEVRQVGNREKAAIVVWGNRVAVGPYVKITANFEILRDQSPVNPITIERAVVVSGNKVTEAGREINTNILDEQPDFYLTFGLDQDIAYFGAFTAGLINYRKELYDSAIEDLSFALSNTPTATDSVGRDVVLFYLGNAYFSQYIKIPGQETSPEAARLLAQAIAAWEEAVRLNNESPEYHFNLGVGYYNQRYLDKAIEQWQETIRLNPKVVEAYTNLAEAYRQQDKPDMATAALQKALAIDTSDAGVHLSLGNVYSDQGNVEAAIAEWTKTTGIDPRSVAAYNNLGIAFGEKGDLSTAIAMYTKALGIDPKDATVHSNLAVAYRMQGDYDKAIAESEKAIGLDPNYAPAHLNLGIAYEAKGDTSKAAEEWQKALQIDPNNAKVHQALGIIYFNQRRFDAAIDAWKKAQELGIDTADLYNDMGDAYVALNRPNDATVYYQRALARDPRFALACSNLAELYIKQGETEQAVALQQDCTDPKSAAALNNLGKTLYLAQRYREASEAYAKAVSLDPTLVEAYEGLGLCYQELGQANDALAALMKAIEVSPGRASTQFYLGNLYFSQKDYEKAIAAYQKTLDLDKDFKEAKENLIRATYNLAAVQDSQKKYPEAETNLKQVIAWDSNNFDAYFVLGDLYSEQGQWSNAVGSYESALTIKPNSEDARHNLALAYYNQGVSFMDQKRWAAAVTSFRQALVYDPGVAEAHLALGNAFGQQSDLTSAMSEYQEAIRLKPELAEAHNNLGVIFLKQQNWSGAIEMFENALRVRPGWADASANLAVAYYNRAVERSRVDDKTGACQDLENALVNGSNVELGQNVSNLRTMLHCQ